VGRVADAEQHLEAAGKLLGTAVEVTGESCRSLRPLWGYQCTVFKLYLCLLKSFQQCMMGPISRCKVRLCVMTRVTDIYTQQYLF
jgi:hypothetical protein